MKLSGRPNAQSFLRGETRHTKCGARIRRGVLLLLAVFWLCPLAAHAQEPLISGFLPPAPAQYVIESADATGEISDGVALLQIAVRVRIFRSEWTEAPLLQGDFSVTSATATTEGDEKGSAFLKRNGGVYSLYAKGKSSVLIKLTVACKVTESGGQKSVMLPMVQALAASTALVLPAENVRFTTQPAADAALEELKDGKSKITLYGSPAQAVHLAWSPQPRLADLPPLMFAEHDAAVEVSRGALRVNSTFHFRVLQGTVKTLTLSLPAKANLLNVNGEGINRWDVKSVNGKSTLSIELAEKIRNHYSFGITTETAIENLSAPMELPLAAAENVRREKGRISIRAQKGIKIEPGDFKNVTQVDVAELFEEGNAEGNEGERLNPPQQPNLPANAPVIQEYEQTAAQAVRVQPLAANRVAVREQRRHSGQTANQPRFQPQMPQEIGLAPADNEPSLPAQADLAFRFLTRPVAVMLKISEVNPKVTASVNTLASISRENVRSLHTINYLIREAGVFRFNLKIPEGLKLIDVNGQNLNTWQIEKNQLGVDLRTKAEGAYTLTIETEQPVEPGKPLALFAPELTGVERETGYIAIASRAGAKVELAGNPTGGAAQVDAAELPQSLRPQGKAVELGLRYLRHPFSITLNIGAVEPEVMVTTANLLTIDERELQLETNLELDVRKSGIFELRLAFPKGWRLSDDPRGKIIEDWRLDQSTGVLTLTFGGRMMGKEQLSLRAEKSIDATGKEQSFPAFSILGAKKETGFLAVTTPLAMRMSAPAGNYRGLNPIPPAELPEFLPAPRASTPSLAFKYLNSGWDLNVALEEIKPLVTSEIVSVADISSTLVSTVAQIKYEIKQAGTDTFYIQLPKNARSIDITGNNIKTRALADNPPKEIVEAAASDKDMAEVWKVILQEKVRGAYALNVTFERPLNKEDKNVSYEGVRALGVEREEGYVGLAASANVEVLPDAAQTRGAAYRIDVRQIPGIADLRPQNPVIWAFQYNSRPYLLDIKVTKHEDVPVVTAVADMAWFETVTGRDGQSTTDLFLSLRNNSQQYLHLMLPDGARIWEAKVNGTLVSPSREKTEGGMSRTLIPIAEASRGGKPFQVTIRYEQSLGKLGQWSGLALDAPVMSIPILRCLWDVYLPEEYGVVNLAGDMAESLIDEQTSIIRFYRESRRQVEAHARLIEDESARSNKAQGKALASSRGLDTGASATSGKIIHRYEKTMALNESQGKTPPAVLRLSIMRDAFNNVSMVLLGLLALAAAARIWKRPLRMRLASYGMAVLLLYMLDTLANDFYPGQVLAVFLVAATAFAAAALLGTGRYCFDIANRIRNNLHTGKRSFLPEQVNDTQEITVSDDSDLSDAAGLQEHASKDPEHK